MSSNAKGYMRAARSTVPFRKRLEGKLATHTTHVAVHAWTYIPVNIQQQR